MVSSCVDISVRIEYPLYDQMLRIASDCGAKVLDTQYAEAVTLKLRMLDGTQQPLLDKITELCRGQERSKSATHRRNVLKPALSETLSSQSRRT